MERAQSELTSQRLDGMERAQSELTSQSMRPSSELTSQSITERRPSSELSADATPLLASDPAAGRAAIIVQSFFRGQRARDSTEEALLTRESPFPNLDRGTYDEALKLAITPEALKLAITPVEEAALPNMEKEALKLVGTAAEITPAEEAAIKQMQSGANDSIFDSISASPAISQHSPEAQRIVTVEARVARPAISQHSPEALQIATVDRAVILPSRDSPEIPRDSPEARVARARARTSTSSRSSLLHVSAAAADEGAAACASAAACVSAAVQSQRDGSGDEDLDPDYRPVDSARSPAEGGLPNAWRPALSEELARLRVAHAQVSAELEAARMNATTEEQRRLALEALASTAQAQAAQLAASLGDRLRQAEQRAAQLEARLGVERGAQQQLDQEAKAMFNKGADPTPAAPKVEVAKVNGLLPLYAAALEVAKAEAEVEAEAFEAQGEALATDAATRAAREDQGHSHLGHSHVEDHSHLDSREDQGQGERAGGRDSAIEAAGSDVTLLADEVPLELPPEEESDSGELTVLSWTKGLGVHRAVAAALQAPLLTPPLVSPEIAPEITPGAALERIKSLTREQVTQLLSTRSFVAALIKLVWNDLSKLPSLAEASSSKVLESKFAGAVELSYSGLDTFFGGLEGIVGSPYPNVLLVR